MKKIFTLIIAAAAISMASCGGKTATDNSNPDSLSAETAVEAAAPIQAAQQIVTLLAEQLQKADVEQIKAIGATIAAKVSEFLSNGDAKAAEAYTAVINNFVADNSAKLKELGAATTISDALAAVAGLPADITEATTQAAEGVKTEALTSVLNAQSAVMEKVNEVQEAAAAAKAAVEAAPEAVKEAAEQQAQQAVDAAQQKAAEEANKAIDDAAAAAKKKLGL